MKIQALNIHYNNSGRKINARIKDNDENSKWIGYQEVVLSGLKLSYDESWHRILSKIYSKFVKYGKYKEDQERYVQNTLKSMAKKAIDTEEM